MKVEKIKKAKAAYYFEDDILSIRPLKRKYDSSVQIGHIIFDLNKKGEINGLEIMNASEFFMSQKLFLKNIVSGKICIGVSNKFIKLAIGFKSLIRNAKVPSSLNIERIRPESFKPMNLQLAVASH